MRATALSNSDLVRKLKALQLFAHLPEAVLQNLVSGCIFSSFDDGDTLFRTGERADYCFVVVYGAVRLAKPLPAGKEVVMCFCRAGDFVGAGIMLNPNPKYPLTASATEATGLIQIPRKQFIDVWQAEASVAKTVNLHMMNRLMEFQEDKTMAVSPVPQRVARFLLRTLESQPTDFGNRLNLRLSRKDIAERVGTSVETVIRVLSQWTRKGWIQTEDQHITVLDKPNLQKLIGEE